MPTNIFVAKFAVFFDTRCTNAKITSIAIKHFPPIDLPLMQEAIGFSSNVQFIHKL